MANRVSPPIDIEIGTLPEQGQGYPPTLKTTDEVGDLIIPGTEEDETLEGPVEETSRDLDAHKEAAELDHPLGSVKTKHLEAQVRALLESFIQGDNEAVFREATRFEESATFEEDVTVNADLTISGGLLPTGKVVYAPVAKSADYTILNDDATVFDVTAGAVDRTLTLPTLADNYGRVIEVHKVDAGVGQVTLEPNAADTDSLEGQAELLLSSQHNKVCVRNMGTYWAIIEHVDSGEWTPTIVTNFDYASTGFEAGMECLYEKRGRWVSAIAHWYFNTRSGLSLWDYILMGGLPYDMYSSSGASSMGQLIGSFMIYSSLSGHSVSSGIIIGDEGVGVEDQFYMQLNVQGVNPNEEDQFFLQLHYRVG